MDETGHAGLTLVARERFRQLQALEDAIAYRSARLAASCPQCEPGPQGRRCDDHACDVALIAGYQRVARTLMVEVTKVTASALDGPEVAAPSVTSQQSA